ncbi:hypothetical protein [[Enterobacter] lignolyticus]|uniref:Uncharacterized protein n=1 Tax=[Enterobacter] lignolyticus TaxID=1334193 RepID=A0A806X7S8_9ENTR|nr:hypothetical protein [[Enterobacter] lignolyticus]ALR77958.1 hypothetical protein AO703_17235 [[Enterobacter] lignolyticus]
MENKYKHDLHEILCLKTVGEAFEAYRVDDYDKMIIDWAERELLSGSSSESLLILASLSLDKHPDSDEIERYLHTYMLEQNIVMPSINASAMTWLRLKTWFLMHAETSKELELRLHQIPAFHSSPGSRILSNICWQFYRIYDDLYDDWGPEYPSKASAMNDADIIDFVKCRVKPFYRILCSSDWAWVLARTV